MRFSRRPSASCGTDQYFERNLSPEEMHALIKAEDNDPLRPFGEACRAEFKVMRARF